MYREVINKLEPYIPGKPISEVKRTLGLEDVIKMASNENPLGPSPKAITAIKKAIDEINFYPEGSCYELKKTLAEKLNLSEDNLIFGNGSDEILLMLSQVFFNPEDEIIQAEPKLTFVEYKTVTVISGATPIYVDLKDYTYDLKGIINKISSKTKLIFIANPNNPTGTIVTKEAVDEFIKIVPPDIIIVFDEAYYEYVERADFPDTISYIKEGKNVITLRTFSKIYGLAGLRIGYGIAKKELIGLLEKVKQPFNVNSIAQVGALAALKDIEYIEKSKKLNNKGKSFLYSVFEELVVSYIPTETNFIFLNLNQDAKPIVNKLLEKGIIVRQIGGETTIRVTIGTEEQNKRFADTLRRIIMEERR